MKTNHRARKVLKLRVRAGVLAVLLLASAEVWMVFRFGLGYGQTTAQPGLEAPSLGDCLAVR